VRSENPPLRIVSIGGGTGLSTLLHGLKPYAQPERAAVDITAVVTVTDDGGSSGRLRREFDVLPPGDIRNCMVTLSEDEALLSRLFDYRFASGRGLKGHSFGNLFLTALTRVSGDFARAVKVSSEVLAIVGRIFPSTADNVSLEARLADGSVVSGESRISRSRSRIESIALKPPHCPPLKETLDAIAQADLITLGPGSLFTSVAPNLLVDSIPAAIGASRAVKAYIVNLMWQPGETTGFSAADHVCALLRHAPGRWLDYAVVNTRRISEAMRSKYARRHAQPVKLDLDKVEALGVRVLARDLLEECGLVRHNPEALAQVALELAREGRRRRLGRRVRE